MKRIEMMDTVLEDSVSNKIFLATTGRGIARAGGEPDGAWSVEAFLEDQDVRSLAGDPLNPTIIYAGTQGNGVFRSEDRGKTWRPVGLSGQVVKSLAVSPHEPGTLYAGTKPAYLFVSRDGGENWAELESFRKISGRWMWVSPAELPFKAYVLAITISPSDPNVIMAGIEAGAVVRSEDGGKRWSGHRKGADRDCHSMTFHVANGDWVYEGGGGGPAVSQDGGRNWRKPKEGLDGRRYCWACAGDPGRPEVWYVSASASFSLKHFSPPAHVDGQANAHIFRSSGGAAWEKLGGGLPEPLNYMAYSLLTDPAAPGHLFAGLSNGEVWFSADYGDSWRKLPFNLGGIHRALIMV